MKDIDEIFDNHTISKCREYYNKLEYCFKKDNYLIGDVYGTYKYLVKFNLDNSEGICSCPVGYNCKHCVALYLNYQKGNFSNYDNIKNQLNKFSKDDLINLIIENGADFTKLLKKLDLKSKLNVNKESKKLVPLKKRILLRGGLVITYILSRIWLSDTHNGYRVMNKKAAKKINLTMDGFEHASEIIDEIAKKKIKYLEVPVYIDYNDYSKSKGQKISNSINIFLKMFFK